ncbi:hypothetical protein [Flavimaricola marinus]|uniref:Uncharacterized protein n=1 Tax=Flavimaricola marinus TaxID=1819565 RepID=A0A238LCB7_9RHOB|nr:hypothetical protein [Flavimaricola marinus]SMY07268.1 hypothetical protein LOM8899_01401 [Flavimaricola marinus]
MSKLAYFSTRPGDTVTAFALGPLEASYFPGAVTRGTDNVDYKFINGFVDVGDLPCRIAIRDDVANRPTPTLEPFEKTALNLPGFNRRLDFSGFWHTPHRLKRWAATRLFPGRTGEASFKLATCGGVHIWVDGEHITAYEPYTRNATQETQITLPLRAEGSDVVLLIEDMAERDTNFFVELTWRGTDVLRAGLPTDADPAVLDTLMDIARAIRPSKVVFDASDTLSLSIDSPCPCDVQISASVGQSVHLSHKPPLFVASTTLTRGATVIDLGRLETLGDGYHPLKLEFAIGAMRIERAISLALLRKNKPTRLPTELSARKRIALRHAIDHGQHRMGRVLALLASGEPLDTAAFEALDDTLDGIKSRRDCSDFVMVPLLWTYGAYADAIPTEWQKRIKQAILGYRYWMDQPGNDTMWFWSENHVLCFHVSEYIAGGLFPDDVFENSGLTGAEHRALADARMTRWYDSVSDHGLAEWNSAAYYPIDFIGLFAMHHWGEGEAKARATHILDQLFTMIALHNIGGVSAGTMGRAYDKELRAGPLTELSPFAAVAFGSGWLTEGVAALPEFCATDYSPPLGLDIMAAPHEGRAIAAYYVQGYGAAARLALHKTAHVQLSAAIDAAPGATGHQQHLVDVQFAASPFARVWVNHPGEDNPWGSNRPSFWAGNGVMPRVGMVENRCLILSKLGADPRLAFTHAYAPVSEFDKVHTGTDWMVLRSGRGAVLLKATGAIEAQIDGPGAGIEHRVYGKTTGWALITVDLAPGATCDALIARARAASLTLTEGPDPSLTLREPTLGELRLDYATGLYVDSVHRPFPTESYAPQISAAQPDVVMRTLEEWT